ncbi:hypothetical protein PA598K_07189, partial [Paenibacillus sp. 598K]
MCIDMPLVHHPIRQWLGRSAFAVLLGAALIVGGCSGSPAETAEGEA